MGTKFNLTKYTTEHEATWRKFVYSVTEESSKKGKSAPKSTTKLYAGTGLFVLITRLDGTPSDDKIALDEASTARMNVGFVDALGFLRAAGYGVQNPWSLSTGKRQPIATESDLLFAPPLPFAPGSYAVCYVSHPSLDFSLALLEHVRTPTSESEARFGKVSELPFRKLEMTEEKVVTLPSEASAYFPGGADRYGNWLLYRTMPYAALPKVREAVNTLAFDLGVLRYPAGSHGAHGGGFPNSPYPESSQSHTGEFDFVMAAALHKFHEDWEAGRFFEREVKDISSEPQERASWTYLRGNYANVPDEQKVATEAGQTRIRRVKIDQLRLDFTNMRKGRIEKLYQAEGEALLSEEQELVERIIDWKTKDIPLADAETWNDEHDFARKVVERLWTTLKSQENAYIGYGNRDRPLHDAILAERKYEQLYFEERSRVVQENQFSTISKELDTRNAERLKELKPPTPKNREDWLQRHGAILERQRAEDVAGPLQGSASPSPPKKTAPQATAAPEPDTEPSEPVPLVGVADRWTAQRIDELIQAGRSKQPPFLVFHKPNPKSLGFWAHPLMFWRFWALLEVARTMGATSTPEIGSTFRSFNVTGGGGKITNSNHKIGYALDVDARIPDPSDKVRFERVKVDANGKETAWLVKLPSSLELGHVFPPEAWDECHKRMQDRVLAAFGLTDPQQLPRPAVDVLSWFATKIDSYKSRGAFPRYFSPKAVQFQPKPGLDYGGVNGPPQDPPAGAKSWLSVTHIAFDMDIGLLGAHNDIADVQLGKTQLWPTSRAGYSKPYILDDLAGGIRIGKKHDRPIHREGDETPIPLDTFDIEAIDKWMYRVGDAPAIPPPKSVSYAGFNMVITLSKGTQDLKSVSDFLDARKDLRVQVVESPDKRLLAPAQTYTCGKLSELLPELQAPARAELRPVFTKDESPLHETDPNEWLLVIPQTFDPKKLEWWHNEVVGKGHFWGDCAEAIGWSKKFLFAPSQPAKYPENGYWTGGAGYSENAHDCPGPRAPARDA